MRDALSCKGAMRWPKHVNMPAANIAKGALKLSLS
jgi:hypothetical protein